MFDTNTPIDSSRSTRVLMKVTPALNIASSDIKCSQL